MYILWTKVLLQTKINKMIWFCCYYCQDITGFKCHSTIVVKIVSTVLVWWSLLLNLLENSRAVFGLENRWGDDADFCLLLNLSQVRPCRILEVAMSLIFTCHILSRIVTRVTIVASLWQWQCHGRRGCGSYSQSFSRSATPVTLYSSSDTDLKWEKYIFW